MADVTINMPPRLSANELDAVRRDPLCAVDDKDEMNKRLGWLVCAYDAIVKQRLSNTPTGDHSRP